MICGVWRQLRVWRAYPPDWVPGYSASLLLSGFCNPEVTEGSWPGGRQQRPSVVCVFSLVPCHKTLLPEHPGVPMCTALCLGTGSLKHLYSRWAPLGDACILPKPRHNSNKSFERIFVVAGSLHNHAINLNWRSLMEHRKTFSTLRQQLFPWVTSNRNWS